MQKDKSLTPFKNILICLHRGPGFLLFQKSVPFSVSKIFPAFPAEFKLKWRETMS